MELPLELRERVRSLIEQKCTNRYISLTLGLTASQVGIERRKCRKTNPDAPSDKDAKRKRDQMRVAANRLIGSCDAETPSLPKLSILNTDADIDPADLKAGESAARAAGLS